MANRGNRRYLKIGVIINFNTKILLLSSLIAWPITAKTKKIKAHVKKINPMRKKNLSSRKKNKRLTKSNYSQHVVKYSKRNLTFSIDIIMKTITIIITKIQMNQQSFQSSWTISNPSTKRIRVRTKIFK
jgi:hypothetical protein